MKEPPNILFVLSDQQRWDTLGCYGQSLPVSPNLDRMAAEGVRFEHAFSCQPVCGPARACLQTGRYATETGCFRNNIALPWHQKTLAHYLADLGYETGYIGKWHLASTGAGLDHVAGRPAAAAAEDFQTRPVPPQRRGGYNDYWLASDVLEFTSHGYGGHLFDGRMRKVEFEGYRVDALTDFAIEYLRSRRQDRPFFLFLSYVEPHHQNDRNRYEGPAGARERFGAFQPPGDLAALPGDWAQQFPDYLGCCASIDQSLGRIRSELEALGSETVVFYTSDHGSHFRTRNRSLEEGSYDDYKRSCHDASIRIPLIAWGGPFRGGKVIRELVSLIDLPPTIVACATAERVGAMRGRPVQLLLKGRLTGWPPEVFVQISESQVGRAIRTSRWKYSVRAAGLNGVERPASPAYREDCLYDLRSDPHELVNLAADPALKEVRAELSSLLVRRMEGAGESPARIDLAPQGSS